jgi:hydrogenase nickel incorporation protein HypA/HybF
MKNRYIYYFLSMHELSMAQEMAKVIREKAGGKPVLSVDISVGAISGVVRESLEFCGQAVFEEAFGPAVKLVTHLSPARALCGCGNEFDLPGPLSPCPSCQGFDRKLIGGRDVNINFIEIDDGKNE